VIPSSSSEVPVVSSSSSSKTPVIPSSSSEVPVVSSSSSKTILIPSSSSEVPIVSHSSSAIVCSFGEYLSSSECKKCSNAMIGCLNCSNGFTCNSCMPGYDHVNGKCKLNCIKLFGEGCNDCSIKTCTSCNGEGCCKAKKHMWKDGKCVNPADEFGEGCLEVEGNKCSVCVAPTCCGAKHYFDYEHTKCAVCSKGCEKCSIAGCLECEEGKIVDGGVCVSCSSVFGAGCSACNKTHHCTKCEEGYYCINGVSKTIKDVFGQECIDYNKTECKQCSSTSNTRVVLVDGECKNCSSLFGEWCTKCNKDSCEECSDDEGVELINGVCVNAANAFGEGCKSFNTNKTKCGSVINGYFIDGYSGLAVSCDALVDSTLREQCKSIARFAVISTTNIKISGRDGNVKVLFDGKDTSATAVDPNCATWDSANNNCSTCKEGYIIYGGMCKSCNEIHGESCTECTVTSCLECSSGFVFHGVCKQCNEFTPHCIACNDDGTCTSCSDNLYVKDGACVDCQTKVGDGCLECSVSAEDNSVTCVVGKCAADTCCSENNTKIIVMENNTMKCGTCSDLDENCVKCTSTKCLSCKDGMAIDSDSGKCISCSELFNGCAECDNYKCTSCSDDAWIKTSNGCYYEEPIPPSSSLDKSSSNSAAIIPKSSSSSESGRNNGGIIAGIVIGVFAFVAIVGVAIYCFVTSGPKYGKVDNSIKEQDIEFKSMSVL